MVSKTLNINDSQGIKMQDMVIQGGISIDESQNVDISKTRVVE